MSIFNKNSTTADIVYIDLIHEAYEYINEVTKYGDLDESDKDMLGNALAALAEVEKEIENEEV